MNNHLIFPIAVFALVGGALAFWAWLDYRRNCKLQQLARRLNMSFIKKPSQQIADQHTLFELFSRGHSQKISNLMERSLGGLSVAYFEYQYTVGHGKHSSTYRQSIVSAANRAVNLPQLVMAPENIFHRIGRLFGGKDIDFENHPKFNRMFRLKGHDETDIRALFSDKALSFFEQTPGLNIETYGNRIIFFKKRHRCSIKQIEAFIKDSLEAYGALTCVSSDGK